MAAFEWGLLISLQGVCIVIYREVKRCVKTQGQEVSSRKVADLFVKYILLNIDDIVFPLHTTLPSLTTAMSFMLAVIQLVSRYSRY